MYKNILAYFELFAANVIDVAFKIFNISFKAVVKIFWGYRMA